MYVTVNKKKSQFYTSQHFVPQYHVVGVIFIWRVQTKATMKQWYRISGERFTALSYDRSVFRIRYFLCFKPGLHRYIGTWNSMSVWNMFYHSSFFAELVQISCLCSKKNLWIDFEYSIPQPKCFFCQIFQVLSLLASRLFSNTFPNTTRGLLSLTSFNSIPQSLFIKCLPGRLW